MTSKKQMLLDSIPRKLPPKAHPLAKVLFREMISLGISYGDIARRAGPSPHTLNQWRRGRVPQLKEIEACLQVVNYKVKAVRYCFGDNP